MADVLISADQAFANVKTGIAGIVTATENLLKAKSVGQATKVKVDKNPQFKAFVEKWGITVVDKPTRSGGFGGAGVIGFFKATFGADSKEAKRAEGLCAEAKSLNEVLKAKGNKQYIAPPFMRGTGTPRTAPTA